MAAQNSLYSSGTHHGTARYVTSGYGNTEQLLQDLRSQLLVEQQKRLVAENRAGNLEKQLKELQELTRIELLREGDRRRDAEKRIHDLELQLKADTEVRKKGTETLSRDQPLLRRGNVALLPVDRTSGERNFSGMDRAENGRQRIVGIDVGYRLDKHKLINYIVLPCQHVHIKPI